MISGIAHVNLTVPEGTLDQAHEFYEKTLGMTAAPVPHLQKDRLAWFDITPQGQQIHIAFLKPFEPSNDPKSSRHPCFKLPDVATLEILQRRIWEHFTSDEAAGEGKGRGGKPLECDEPGGEGSGSKGIEYPTRFFARDYAGNRLEFSI